MSFQIPNRESGQWKCAQNGDRFGVLVGTKNVDLDDEGYLKLAPRTVKIFGNTDDGDFDRVVSINYQNSQWWAFTDDDNFTFAPGTTATQDALTGLFSGASDALNFNAEQWATKTGDANVSYRTTGNWSTFSAYASTASIPHPMCLLGSTNQVAVGHGNVLKLLDAGHTIDGTNSITLDASQTITTVAAQGDKLLVGTKAANGQSLCVLWNGTGTAPDGKFPVNAGYVASICAYKSSFAILTSLGRILWFTGNGFEELAALPTYYSGLDWSQDISNTHVGHRALTADGDLLYVNVGNGTAARPANFPDKRNSVPDYTPAGVWVYDPAVGLYHRHGPSQGKRSILSITTGNVDTATDILTVTAAPATGTPVVAVLTAAGDWGANVLSGNLYYAIFLSSTTMALASTRALATAGTKIDLTAAANTVTLFAFPETDFGQYLSESAWCAQPYRNEDQGADWWEASRLFFGGDTATPTSLTASSECLNTAVFQIPNRGYAVTAKVPANAVIDAYQFAYLYFRPLQTAEDAIIVKYRTAERAGFPIRYASLTWTNGTTFTTTDTRFANVVAGDEIELIAGRGAGVLAHVSTISGTSTYTVVLTESVPEVAASDVSYANVDNWTALTSVTAATQSNAYGYAKVPIPAQTVAGGFIQLKVEMRGADVAIREAFVRSETRRDL